MKITAKKILEESDFNCNYITLMLLDKFIGTKEPLQSNSEIFWSSDQTEKFVGFLLTKGGDA